MSDDCADVISALVENPLADVKARISELSQFQRDALAVTQANEFAKLRADGAPLDNRGRAAAVILTNLFVDVAVSDRVCTPEVLLSGICCLISPAFGIEADACIIKVINNGALPHSRLHACILENRGIPLMLSTLLRGPPAVHEKVELILLTFLHRFASLCRQAREAIIVDADTFVTLCTVVRSLVRRICTAEEAEGSTQEQLMAGLEALKLMYAVLFVGPVAPGRCSEALSNTLCCVGSLFLIRPHGAGALLPLEEQFVNLCLVSTDAVLEHMDARLVNSFSRLLQNQMSRHDRTDVANPANIKLTSSIHVAMRLASHEVGRAALKSVVVPTAAAEVPPHIFACMQSFDLRVKDSIQELAWILCGCDGPTLLQHYGMGLAAGLLQAKGLIEVPAASTA